MNNQDLKNLVARVNNLIMQGTFGGDAIHEASYLMQICTQLHKELSEESDVESKEV